MIRVGAKQLFWMGLLINIFSGCSVSGEESIASKQPVEDTITASISVDSVSYDATVDSTWNIAENEYCDNNHSGAITINFVLLNHETRAIAAIGIPFDGENVPEMPVNPQDYRYLCAGASPELTQKIFVAYSYVTEFSDGEAVDEEIFNYFSGQVTVDVVKEGRLIKVSGSFHDVVLKTLDGSKSVTISGEFTDDGIFEDCTDPGGKCKQL